jgi:diadenosine tetraphosphate (Ap4A) HIT family hydrolase
LTFWPQRTSIHTVHTCPFCAPNVDSRIEHRQGSVAALKDAFPVTEGHFLLVPDRHVSDYFAMNETERRDLNRLLQVLRAEIAASDPSVEGFNIGMNCGEVAGQTVDHAHVHLIPRRRGDTPQPRGGVRGVIPAKMNYSAPAK